MTDPTRVLYVDDEPDLLEIGKIFLEANGDFAVDTLTSARQALARLKDEKYDAIVSDYQMPDIDGITFLKELKASGSTTPFIIFTGRGREEVVIEALNNGADFYIQKGGDPASQFAELSNKIRYAVSRKHFEEALGVSEVLEKEMEYHEMELIKFYNQSLNAANKKLKLIFEITRYDIISQLTVLQLYHELLQKNLSDTPYAEYFNKLGTATERISSIIRFAERCEEIGVNTPIWADISGIIEVAKKEGVHGRLRMVNDIPPGTEVYADILINNVFYNLIDNAVQSGGKITMIRFSLQESGDSRVIVCEDDGEGIPAEDRERIFDGGLGKKPGFGLALSREILDITGIRIRETGEPGKGARFEIHVPKGVWRLATDDKPEG